MRTHVRLSCLSPLFTLVAGGWCGGSLGAQQPAPPAAPTSTIAPNLIWDRVLHDDPGDGALWAAGRTYKASFDRNGLTYIPFFGPNSPKNSPPKYLSSSHENSTPRERLPSAGGALNKIDAAAMKLQ